MKNLIPTGNMKGTARLKKMHVMAKIIISNEMKVTMFVFYSKSEPTDLDIADSNFGLEVWDKKM